MRDNQHSGTGKLLGIRLQLGWRRIGRALTENVAEPAYGQHRYCAPVTRVVFLTNLNNLHGPCLANRLRNESGNTCQRVHWNW